MWKPRECCVGAKKCSEDIRSQEWEKCWCGGDWNMRSQLGDSEDKRKVGKDGKKMIEIAQEFGWKDAFEEVRSGHKMTFVHRNGSYWARLDYWWVPEEEMHEVVGVTVK